MLYLPINSIGYPRIKKLQRDNLWHAYNEPMNIYSVRSLHLFVPMVQRKKTAHIPKTFA